MTKEKFLEKFNGLCKYVLVGEEKQLCRITSEEKLNLKAEETYETLKKVVKFSSVKNVSIIEEAKINKELYDWLEIVFILSLEFDNDYNHIDYKVYAIFDTKEYKLL